MFYVIKRETDLPFEQSIGEITLQDDVFDVIKFNKNSGLEIISDFIVDDNKVIIKSNPRHENSFKKEFEKLTNIKLQELLLG